MNARLTEFSAPAASTTPAKEMTGLRQLGAPYHDRGKCYLTVFCAKLKSRLNCFIPAPWEKRNINYLSVARRYFFGPSLQGLNNKCFNQSNPQQLFQYKKRGQFTGIRGGRQFIGIPKKAISNCRVGVQCNFWELPHQSLNKRPTGIIHQAVYTYLFSAPRC